MLSTESRDSFLSKRRSDYQDENKELQDKVTELDQRDKRTRRNGRRWQEMKEAFSIKELYSDYDIVVQVSLHAN